MKKENINRTGLLNKSFSQAFKQCMPMVVTLELTQNCNFSCKHCYNYDRSGSMPESIRKNALDPQEIIQVIDQLPELGALYVNFSGGEALLNPHIEDFLQRARNNGLEPRLKTNGFLLTEDKCNRLQQAGLRAVDISLYGSNEKTYLDFTCVKSGYEKAIQGIKNIKKIGIDISINIILHKNNVEELSEMIRFCDEHQISYQISTEVTERYDKSKGARDYEITDEQFERLLLGPYGNYFMTNNSDCSVQCSCARSVCGISAVGDVFPCIGAPIYCGNIRKEKLIDIWKNSPEMKKIRELKPEDFKECMQCEYIEFCNRSSGTVYVNTGNYTGCDERYLAQAKIRAKYKKHFS